MTPGVDPMKEIQSEKDKISLQFSKCFYLECKNTRVKSKLK